MRPGSDVLITGGGTGLGCFLAERFARQGHRVFVTLRTAALPDALSAFPAIHPLLLDVRRGDQIANAFRVVTEDHRVERLDVLINNAGVAIPGPLETLPIEEVADQFDVNLLGVLRVTQQFLPLVRAARGRILNVGSISASMSLPFAGAYGASKAALKSVTWAMRLELRPWGIQVFHLEAGNFDTPIWKKAFERGASIDSDLYRPFLTTALAVIKARSRRTNDPEALWKAVERICQDRHPRFNTVVDRDAWFRRVTTTLLPDRLLESFIARTLKL
jgi:NAD(P)-dependent dehydrogenase (short-subunit alcohol dehydrogenase family)